MSWNQETIDRLVELWHQGWSGGQIAGELGMTRNAVLGKLGRTGELGTNPNRNAPPRSAPRPKRTKGFKYKPVKAPPTAALGAQPPTPLPKPAPGEPAPKLLSILQLTSRTCRWPIGDVGAPNFGFCGHTPVEGWPYCGYHAQLSYPGQRAA